MHIRRMGEWTSIASHDTHDVTSEMTVTMWHVMRLDGHDAHVMAR